MKTKVAVFVSGNGSLLDPIRKSVDVSLVFADRVCYAADRALAHGLPVEVLLREDFSPAFDMRRAAYTSQALSTLEKHDIGLIAMAGFKTILAPVFFERYRDRVLNIHPSLLPAFKGPHAVADALAARVRFTGTTVHIATERVDEGPILAQRRVSVRPKDSVETLRSRIRQRERHLYPQVLGEYLQKLG